MAASNEIAVKFIASLQGLETGLAQARAAIDRFTAGVKSGIEGLASPFKKLEEAFLGIAALAGGGVIFKSFIDATVDATTETMKLSKAMGISMEAASVWRTELKTVGLPVEDFTDMIMKLDRQVRTNSETFQKAGVATKDANGNLLSQEQILNNAIKRLGDFKEGTDRNIAAQTMFGRSVGNTTALMRLTGEAAQRAARDAEELHLIASTEEKQQVIAYKVAINEMNLAFEAMRNVIGKELLPLLTQYATFFRTEVGAGIGPFEAAVKSAIEAVIEYINSVGNVWIRIQNTFEQVKIILDALMRDLIAAKNILLDWSTLNPLTWADKAEKFMDEIHKSNLQIAEDMKQRRADLQDEILLWNAFATAAGKGTAAAKPEPPKGTESATGLIKTPGADTRTKEQEAAFDRQITMLKLEEEETKAFYDRDVAMYGMTQTRKNELLSKLAEDTYQKEHMVLEQKAEIGTLEVAERQKILDQIEQLEIKHSTEVVRLQITAFEDMKKNIMEVFNTITGSFNGQLRGLLAGTTKFKDAIKTMAGDMIIAVIQAFEKMAAEWAATQLAMTLTGQAGVAARTAAEHEGAAASIVAAVGRAMSKIGASVGETIAGVTANQAPLVGPAAPAEGIAAGAVTLSAAMAAIGSIGAGIGFAESGWWNVPRMSPALLHAGEMVVPKPFADDLRDNGGGMGGATHLHFPGIMDSGAFLNAVKNNASPIARMIAKAMTQNPSLRPAY